MMKVCVWMVEGVWMVKEEGAQRTPGENDSIPHQILKSAVLRDRGDQVVRNS